MRNTRDLFSDDSGNYLRFRPTYPKALFEEIFRHTQAREKAWDCATGNGQVAGVLASYFKQVMASDISQNQLDSAPSIPNVNYQKSAAETTPFMDNTFDLITVAQAAHWFNLEDFRKEVMRVGKPNGILAVWGYGLVSTEDPINGFIRDFYGNQVGRYWNPERRHLDNEYKHISFGFEEIEVAQNFEIVCSWSLKHLEGYLRTWSAVGNYVLENPEEDPVSLVISKMAPFWEEKTIKEMKFPIYLSISKIPN